MGPGYDAFKTDAADAAAAASANDDPAPADQTDLERDLTSRPFSPLDLLVQRAVQTQLFYCSELRNEPLAAWLRKFEGHAHLTGVPIRGSWHSCLGLRLPARTYLEAMLRAEPYTYTVRGASCIWCAWEGRVG
jgi:hypothetical protein